MTSLDLALGRTVVCCITGYQRYLSPHKGFSCAHRVLHQGESCSGYIKRVILQQGLKSGVRLARQRFAACKEAAYVLSTQRDDRASQSSRFPRLKTVHQAQPGNSWRNDCCDGLEVTSNACEILSCAGEGAEAISSACEGLSCAGDACSCSF